jgi:hypothetical protein
VAGVSENGFKTLDDSQSLPENVLLKPKLDRIFADVETSLPAIDFDMSDVSQYVSFCYYFIMLYYFNPNHLLLASSTSIILYDFKH